MAENQAKNKMTIWQLIWENKFSFFVNVLIVLSITFSLLYIFGFVPNELKMIVGREPVKESKGDQIGELPLSIKIPEVGVDAVIYNPSGTSTAVLDNWLEKGAVRYPGSGLLGSNGNVLVFGHSTSYKVVSNQAYKTFVGLKNLKAGDLISVFSGTTEYTYKVLTVEMKEANDFVVYFETNKKLLTLFTCNTSIGDKSARYVVQAEFVSKNAI